ncbi:hypothetical protein HY745_03805 [Candidatus Desantisbacteria bacterium]|nr:hypothetical protein [Candidatus Desantisbacteria bacterium]
MTKKENIERNIGMTFNFIKHLVEHPEIINTLPDGAEITFIDKDMPFKAKEYPKRKKIARYRIEHIFEPIKA